METFQSTTPSTGFKEQIPTIDKNTRSVSDTKITNSDFLFSQSFTLAVDENCSQLSTPLTNNVEELSIPREIISSSISTTKLQSELVRPLIAGTYCGIPAYLLKLQFQFQVPEGGRNWLNRIKVASISIVLEDAPRDGAVKENSSSQSGRKRRTARPGTDVKNPAIVKTYPGPEGWEGPISTMPVSNDKGVGIQAGWGGLGASVSWNQNRTKDDTSTAKVTTMRTGPQRNSLIVTVTENTIDALGIPSFLVVPLILTHHSRRFSMRVTVKATFGFWRGKLAESIPVLGRADEPLLFDPTVLEGVMEAEGKGIGGVKVVEWCGELEEMDLRVHSSLGNSI